MQSYCVAALVGVVGLLAAVDPVVCEDVASSQHRHRLTGSSASGSGGGKRDGSIRTRHRNRRRVLFADIALYTPLTQVTNQLVIDLDLNRMKGELNKNQAAPFSFAEQIYKNGGHSGAYAEITLNTAPTALNQEVPKGTVVTGETVGVGGTYVTAKTMEKIENGTKVLKLEYFHDIDIGGTAGSMSSHVSCHVGALQFINAQETNGCFKDEGFLQIENVSGLHPYKYNVLTDNRNFRTLASFSGDTNTSMMECSRRVPRNGLWMLGQPFCPYFPTFHKVYNYYGYTDYANRYIQAAFDGAAITNFNHGNGTFADWGFAGRGKAVEVATLTMSIFMEVIRNMELSLVECRRDRVRDDTNMGENMNYWDTAVAYYMGSLEGTSGTMKGTMLQNLANEMCSDFRTCEIWGSQRTGKAKVNYDILDEFTVAQENFKVGNCPGVRENKNRVIQLMTVPLIQGLLKHSYHVAYLEGGETDKAAAAMYGAALAPLVYSCSMKDADIIHQHLNFGHVNNFRKIRDALRRNYGCLGVKCHEIGGLFHVANNTYYVHAEPCHDNEPEPDKVAIALLIICMFFAVIICACWIHCCCVRCKDRAPMTDELVKLAENEDAGEDGYAHGEEQEQSPEHGGSFMSSSTVTANDGAPLPVEKAGEMA